MVRIYQYVETGTADGDASGSSGDAGANEVAGIRRAFIIAVASRSFFATFGK